MDSKLLSTDWRAIDQVLSDVWIFLESDSEDAELLKAYLEAIQVIVYRNIYVKK